MTEKSTHSGGSDASSGVSGDTLSMQVCPSCGMRMAYGTIKCPNDGTEIVAKFKAGDRLSEKYEFLEPVGAGGMGIIYKARHLALNRIVAIKLLHPYLLNAETILRFQREARTASKLRHANLIEVQDIGSTDDGQPFMVMDFVSGKSLSEAVKESGRIPVEQTVSIFLQLCSGLAYAHKQSILHRDLKPSNVMLVKDEHGHITARILDFGIAKILEDEDKQAMTLTKTGDVFGSPLYMSPEQGAGGKLDQRSDCYSLGCMLFECLTGTTPFIGKSIIETLMLHAQQKVPTLKEATLGLEFPEALEKIVEKLLRKNPAERYQSVIEVEEDLQQLQSDLTKDDSEAVVSKRDLRQLAGGDSTAIGTGKKKADAAGKDIAIVLLSIAVVVLLAKDAWLSYKATEGVKIAENKKYKVDVPKVDQNTDLERKIANNLNAKEFELCSEEISDVQLKPLARLRRVEKLKLDGNIISGTGMDVAKSMPHLKKLSLSENPLTERGIETIAQLDQLENLEIKEVHLSDDSVATLSRMQFLKKLELDDSQISCNGIQYLSGMRNLDTLALSGQHELNDRCFGRLKDMPKLVTVDVSKTNVSGEVFENPSFLPRLREIAFKENGMSKRSFKAISNLKELRTLDIRDSKFDLESLMPLKKMPHLEEVKVSERLDLVKLKKMLPKGCKIQAE